MEEITVKELFQITKGKKVEQTDSSSLNKVRFIQIDDLRNNNNIKYCHNDSKYVYASKYDLIIAWDGANAGTIGHNLEGAIGSTLAVLKRKRKDFNITYVAKFLQSKSRFLRDSCTGATIPHISRAVLEGIKIPLPSIEIQNYIVSLLNKVQYLIDKRIEQREALSSLPQSVFLDMFGDPLSNNYGFQTDYLKNICKDIKGGGTPSKSKPEFYNGDIPWVTPKDMKTLLIKDSIDHINEEAIEKSSTKLIPANSLLMVIRSGILKRYLPVAINKREVTLNQDMKAFILDSEIITPEYLLSFFQIYQRKLLSQVRSVTADNLDFNQIKDIIVPIPPIEKQIEFSKIFNEVNSLINRIEKQLSGQEKLFNSLLHRSLSGKLFNNTQLM
ncbi:restriction endonuclease S subunit [Mycobacteroides abscessus subsp. abscessus]|nr:restriction endonuclease S subunit [Mycobacteroides abscessus subsp. abscessus]